MKHRVSLVVAFACAFCFALGLAGCSQAGSYEGKTLTPTISSPTIGQNGTLRVGIDADGGAPFVTSSSSASYAGIDVDMAAALADQLGLKLELFSPCRWRCRHRYEPDVHREKLDHVGFRPLH